jgi:hypothetical protein
LRFGAEYFRQRFGLFLTQKWEEFHSEQVDS